MKPVGQTALLHGVNFLNDQTYTYIKYRIIIIAASITR